MSCPEDSSASTTGRLKKNVGVLALEGDFDRHRQRLEELGVGRVFEQRGRELFDREDVDRLIEFQTEMRKRFQKDLRILDPQGAY